MWSTDRDSSAVVASCTTRHDAANTALTLLSDLFTNLNLTDMETCYKVFRREVLREIRLKSNRFGFEPEITAKIAKRNPLARRSADQLCGAGPHEEGKKITVVGWVQGVVCIC